MPPELELEQIAPELIGTGAQAIVDNAKRLGLTWTLRIATVNISSLNELRATYDGDTVPINMTSMVGPLAVDQRVYVIQVPPSGNFIVGFAGRLLLDNITTLGANGSTAGAIASSTGLEVAVAGGSWNLDLPLFRFRDGHVFRVIVTTALDSSVADNAAFVRVRQGTGTSGLLLIQWETTVSVAVGASNPNFCLAGYFQNSSGADVEDNLSLTLQRFSGAGTYRIFADATRPTFLAVDDIGLAVNQVGIAAGVPSVT